MTCLFDAVIQGSDILLVHRRRDPVPQNTPTEIDVPLFEVLSVTVLTFSHIVLFSLYSDLDCILESV